MSGSLTQAARHDDLLLVAAAERGDRGAGALRLDLQPPAPLLDDLALATQGEPALAAEPAEDRQREVLADRELRDHALALAVRRDERDVEVLGVLRRRARTPRRRAGPRR